MNKLKFLFVFVFCIFLSGCGKQTLTCIKNEKNDIGRSKSKITFLFNNNSIISAKIDTTMTLNVEYNNYNNIVKKKINENLKAYDEKKGIRTDFSSSNNKIKTSINFNLSKMSKSDKDSIGFDSSGSKKKVKKFYEKEGFKCN